MDSPQFRYLNKKELSYIYEGNSNNVTLSSLLTLSHPFKYSQIIQSIKFSLNIIQQYYPMTRSCISKKNDKWCFCEKSFIIPSDSSSSPIPQNFPPKQISSIAQSDILQNEIPFNWIKIPSSNETILNTLENLCSQEMTNDFIVENNLCRFTLVTSENFTNPSNSQIIDTTKEVGFVFCFLHTAFDGKNIFTITHDFIKEFKKALLNSRITTTFNMTSDLIIEQELKEGQINNLILPKYQTFYSNLIFFKEVLILIGWLIYMSPRNLPFSTSSSKIQSQLQSEKSEKFYQSNQSEIKTITYFHTLTRQETSYLIQFCKQHKFSITSLLSTCISEIISTKNGYNTVLGGLAVDLRQFLNISKKINGAFNSSILIRHPKVEYLLLLKDENFDKKFYMKYLVDRIIITNISIQNSMKSGFIFHNLKFLINEPIKNNNNNVIINEGEEIKNNSIIPLGYVLSNLGICNQNIFDKDSTDNIITDWNDVFLSSTAKSSRGSNIEVTTLTLDDKMYMSFCACSKFISDEDLRDFANNVLDLIRFICEYIRKKIL